MPDFYSGATDQLGRFIEGFLLRRLHYGRRSTIVTSQLPVTAWHDVIGDPTYADAVLDRLVHNAHRIELAGESLRRARGKQAKSA